MKGVETAQMTIQEAVGKLAGNRLLARLTTEDAERMRAHLQPVDLQYRRVFHEAGQPIEFVYFPLHGVASLVKTMENGSAAEVGTAGNEGMVGVPILFGQETSAATVHVQVPGDGLRMPARALREVLAQSAPMRHLMRNYAYTVFAQVSQIAACNQFHDVEQRCARWLLMAHDRVAGDDFMLTHEVLGLMLGVRRSSVTVAAGRLSEAGLIEYRRGRVSILDRPGLEARACECYAAIRHEYDRLLGPAV